MQLEIILSCQKRLFEPTGMDRYWRDKWWRKSRHLLHETAAQLGPMMSTYLSSEGYQIVGLITSSSLRSWEGNSIRESVAEYTHLTCMSFNRTCTTDWIAQVALKVTILWCELIHHRRGKVIEEWSDKLQALKMPRLWRNLQMKI